MYTAVLIVLSDPKGPTDLTDPKDLIKLTILTLKSCARHELRECIMKKISILFIALVTSVGTMFAESGTCGDNLTWDLTDGVLTINGSGDMTDWPWYPDVPWYSYRESITSVTIGNSVTSIGISAFLECSRLTSVTIPNSVTSIGNDAFCYCKGLTDVTIGNSVTSIGINAFYECTSMTSITIPNSVTSIGAQAFYGCSGLTSVTIPNSVTSIGGYAFASCSGLTSVVVETGNIVYDSRENCNAIIETATNTLITGCQNTTIPNSVTSIGSGAFRYCSGLTSVTIPNSVTSIGYGAFIACSGLTSVTIPNSVTSIGNNAFAGCSSLTSVTIPNSVTSIGERAFWGCYGLTSVVVKNGNIVYDSRDNCNAIIETSTNTLISGCKNTIIPNSVTSIGDGAFGACFDLTGVTIPNSVTSIGNSAFMGCSGLTSITIPNSVTSIGNDAFFKCSGLTSIEIPNSVTSIGESAFEYCSGLTSVTIGNSVTSIGFGAFAYCEGLTSITCEAANPPTCDGSSYVFYNVDKSIPLYVPAASIQAYKTANAWSDFTNIQATSTQGIDDVETGIKATKFLHNDQIYILRGDHSYTITGQEVR